MPSLPLALRPLRPLTKLRLGADVTAVFFGGKLRGLPPAVLREAGAHLRRAGFKGEANETHAVPLSGRPPRTLFVVGVGKELTTEIFRRGVAAAVQHAKAEGARTVTVILHSPFSILLSPVAVGRAFAEGALLANYRFTAYKAERAKREHALRLTRVELLVPRGLVPDAERGVRRGTLEAEATMLARDLVNEPSSRMTPAALVEQAKRIAAASRGAIALTILNRKQCEARGMGAFLAVAKGSAEEPAFIHLVYRPAGTGRRAVARHQASSPKPQARVVLVGKGITFDSGGLSIKPAEGMETMKIDMAGAAAVLGAFSVLARLQAHAEVHGMIAACENMPSGSALKPGDIVRTVLGKTIEVLNTDAEGRLTLADTLGEAVKVQPAAIIDLATLTGACMVALGEEIAGLWSNDDRLSASLTAAAEAAGEPLWPLPLFREYGARMKSEVADLKNISGRKYGGAITAALFLKEFVGETPWAHVDIAGPSYAEKQTNPLNPVGGTGFGVRTLLHYLEGLGA